MAYPLSLWSLSPRREKKLTQAKHIFNFAKFNHVRFLPRDFVEGVDFDYLLLENIVV